MFRLYLQIPVFLCLPLKQNPILKEYLVSIWHLYLSRLSKETKPINPHIERIYYKKLTHIIWKQRNPKIYSQQTRDLGAPMGQSHCKSPGLGSKRANDVISHLNASKLQTQEELIFQFEFESYKRPISQLKDKVEGVPPLLKEGSDILFNSGLQLIE